MFEPKNSMCGITINCLGPEDCCYLKLEKRGSLDFCKYQSEIGFLCNSKTAIQNALYHEYIKIGLKPNPTKLD